MAVILGMLSLRGNLQAEAPTPAAEARWATPSSAAGKQSGAEGWQAKGSWLRRERFLFQPQVSLF